MTFLVKDFMNKDIITIDSESNITDASKKIAESPRGYAVILDKGHPKGMLTERDIIRNVVAKELDPSKVKVNQVMSSPLVTISPDVEVTTAAETMRLKNVRKLPVEHNGILYGVITARDITDHFAEYVDKAIKEVLIWSPFRFS
ncbi:CBS domain-containing protein [Candidatus Bathyarchaeota archaeon]|nr:CBS domain-containing protein [Candidatus Bathyarchaeota archaeon]